MWAKIKLERTQRFFKTTKMNIGLEYAKYILDPSYCIEQNFQVFDATQNGYVNYRLFTLQKKLIKAYDTNRHNIVAKPRQAGVSTTTAAYLAVKIALATKESPEKVYILANKLEQSIAFLIKVREFTTMIPKWVWGEDFQMNKDVDGHIVGKGAAKKINFVNGSYIEAKACTADALRGVTPTYLIIDEAAFITEGAKTYAAAAASVATGGKMILISTPNGMDELYYKTYNGALLGDNDFNIVKMHWAYDPRYNKDLVWIEKDNDGNIINEIPETDFSEESIEIKLHSGYYPISTWFRKMCADLNNDKKAIAQELEVKFEGSGGNVIDFNTIDWYEKNVVKEPEVFASENLSIFKDVEDGKRYIAGLDVSTGDGNDYSVLTIYDVDEFELVLEYRAKVNDEQMADIVYEYCNKYNALTVIDTTGGYASVIIHILKSKDFNLFFMNDDYDVTQPNSNDINDKNKKIGLKLQKYRHAAIANYTSKIEKRQLKVYSKKQVAEWKTFVWKNGRQDHQSSFNDDCIMSSVLALWVLEQVYDKIERAKARDKKVLNAFITLNDNRPKVVLNQNDKKENLKRIHGDNAWLFF